MKLDQDARLAAARIEFVAGTIGYLQPGVAKPCNYMYEPPAGVERENCRYEYKSVFIRNGRHIQRELSVDKQGFELRPAPTAVANCANWPWRRPALQRRMCLTIWSEKEKKAVRR
jgi:hypothetical protein